MQDLLDKTSFLRIDRLPDNLKEAVTIFLYERTYLI